jgi:hypothetical protein
MNDAHLDALRRQLGERELTRRSALRLLTGASLATGLTAIDRDAARAQDPLGKRNPLLQFWHNGRTDNILTATPAGWASARQAGYDLVRVEGWVRPEEPQGVGSENFLPLRLLWHPQRRDNLTTADVTAFALARLRGYELVRNEGWVWRSIPQSLDIDVFWNAARQDYFTTATDDGRNDARNAGYTRVRRDGWLDLPPLLFGPGSLKTFWHEGRKDYFTATSDRATDDAGKTGYQYLLLHGGLVETVARPGTVPLDLYWHPGRQDNFLTATQEGRQSALDANYGIVRTEAWVWPTATAVPLIDPEWVAMPLALYWHAGNQDNLTTASPVVAEQARADGYVFIRNEGFVPMPLLF